MVQDDRIAFAVTESRQGLTDLNGDGDTGDVVLHVADVSPEDARSRIEALLALLRSMGLPRPTEYLHAAFLRFALQGLDRDDPCKAIAWLQLFDFSVKLHQGWKKIPQAQANELRAEAQAILSLLRAENPGCKLPGHGLCDNPHVKHDKKHHECKKYSPQQHYGKSKHHHKNKHHQKHR
jgi:hypothetical protein